MGFGSFLGNMFSPIGDVLGAVTGSTQTGKAMQGRAQDQYAQAQIEREQARQISAPTAQELDMQMASIQNAQRQAQFEQSQLANLGALLGQISPVLAAGYQQQMAILSGQDTGALANPISRQIEIERQRQVSRIGQATGTGESTASIAANAQFAQQAGMARMNALQALSGINAQNMGAYTGALGAINQTTANTQNIQSSVLKALGSTQERQLNAALNTSLVNQAGAQYVGKIYQGQSEQGMLNTALGGAAGAWAGKKV